MFRWGAGVPHPCLDRMHAVLSHTPEVYRQTQNTEFEVAVKFKIYTKVHFKSKYCEKIQLLFSLECVKIAFVFLFTHFLIALTGSQVVIWFRVRV